MVRPVAERALRLPAFRKQCPDAGKQVLLAGVAAPLRVVRRVRQGQGIGVEDDERQMQVFREVHGLTGFILRDMRAPRVEGQHAGAGPER